MHQQNAIVVDGERCKLLSCQYCNVFNWAYQQVYVLRQILISQFVILPSWFWTVPHMWFVISWNSIPTNSNLSTNRLVNAYSVHDYTSSHLTCSNTSIIINLLHHCICQTLCCIPFHQPKLLPLLVLSASLHQLYGTWFDSFYVRVSTMTAILMWSVTD